MVNLLINSLLQNLRIKVTDVVLRVKLQELDDAKGMAKGTFKGNIKVPTLMVRLKELHFGKEVKEPQQN